MTRQEFADVGIQIPADAHPDPQGNIRIICPVCTPMRKPEHQREKDLSVNIYRGTWYCHHVGCDFHGGLAGWPGGPLEPRTDASLIHTPRSARERVWSPPRPLPPRTAPSIWEQAMDYLAKRGISEDTAKAMRLTASIEWCGVCQQKTLHILYPYYVNGRHTNTKHRCVHKHFRMEAGAELSLYNIDAIRGEETFIVVEGEQDVLALIEAGHTNVVSVPNGTTMKAQGALDYLNTAEDLIFAAKRIILATDADQPGQELMYEFARRFGMERCSRVVWPMGLKDANDALTEVGKDFLYDLILRAEPFPIPGITTGEDLTPDMENMYQFGLSNGYKLGYRNLDPLFRVEPGQLTVVVGIPGHGKSSVIDNFILREAETYDWNIGIFSPEQMPLSRHQKALIEIRAGKPFLPNYNGRMSYEEFKEHHAFISDHISYIDPDNDDFSVDNILALAAKEVFRRGIRDLVLDPWNEYDHKTASGETKNDYVARILGKIRRWARNHNCHVWQIVHPRKQGIDPETGKERIPELEDALDSSAFRAKADNGLTVWRDITEEDDRFLVRVTKVRWKELGRRGDAWFHFDLASGRIKPA